MVLEQIVYDSEAYGFQQLRIFHFFIVVPVRIIYYYDEENNMPRTIEILTNSCT